MHSDVVCPVLIQADGNSVIQVFSCLGVDSEYSFATQIFSDLKLSFRYPKGSELNKKASGIFYNNLRPGKRWQALDDTFCEILCWEVAIFQESTGLYFDVADGTQLFN